MYVPLILGKPLHLWLGIIMIFLLVFQVLTGKRILKLPFVYHRLNAIAIIIIAAVHAFFGLGIWFFNFQIR
ncbi:hypothetical protein [Candidatus Formimonas warabiya]|uniref:Cytochrome b561 domain-containing protein n=1 Tax=Formimonas warabiya TaxID=1761012 RepID=A0A3G1L144_FORW1|nr:hypothetical protein [Candidatus Formimonas warabiya]ATW28205.1 hypothetical protein DCMF_28690 [Candidatus Formimonas warabiya]